MDDFTFKAKSLPFSQLFLPCTLSPSLPHGPDSPPQAISALFLCPTPRGKKEEGRKQASASLWVSLSVSPPPWRDGHCTSPRNASRGLGEMGSCASAQRSSSLESAVKRSLSSASQMEKPMGDHHPRSAAVGAPPASRRTPTFSDFGSKEDKFFETQAWMESDCEDEFFSVKGDFTPSRGNTPVHGSFFTSTPQRITTFFKDETLGSIPRTTPAGGKKKLAELFQESFRGGQCLNGDNKYANNPTNLAQGFRSPSGSNSVHSSKMTAGGGSTIVEEKHVTPFQDCLSSLVSCGGSSKRRRKMTPAIAIHG